jgi:hypothetical protein
MADMMAVWKAVLTVDLSVEMTHLWDVDLAEPTVVSLAAMMAA